MAEPSYKIEVYDSHKLLFEAEIPTSKITKAGLHGLLKSLAAKYGLKGDEIVDSYLSEDATGYRDLLEVRPNQGAKVFSLSCGDNPHVIATEIRPGG